MPFNVNEIVAELSKSGTAKSSHFEVFITSPFEGDSKSLAFRCNSAEIPGRTLTTTETKFGNYGPIAKVAYGQVYTDVTLTFILSEDLREKQFFENWHQGVMDTGAFEQRKFNALSFAKFNANYYRDYIGVVEIRQYGEGGDLRSIHTLNEAYPIILGGLPMNWSDEEVIKMPVTFSYRNYRVLYKTADQPGLGAGFALRLDKTGLAASARGAFGNINIDRDLGGIANINLKEAANQIKTAGLGKIAKIRKTANLI